VVHGLYVSTVVPGESTSRLYWFGIESVAKGVMNTRNSPVSSMPRGGTLVASSTVMQLPFPAHAGLSFAVSGFLKCRVWAMEGGSGGRMRGYRSTNCRTIDAVPVADSNSTPAQKLAAATAATLSFDLDADITGMVLFKHELNSGMYAAALRCKYEPGYACAMEIHEFFVRSCTAATRRALSLGPLSTVCNAAFRICNLVALAPFHLP
jgi:hypothetical protein